MSARLGRVLDEAEPDLVHPNDLLGFSVSALTAAKRRRLPAVRTAHDHCYVRPETSMLRGGANCARQRASRRVAPPPPRKRLGGRADMVCGVSGAMLRRI